MILLALKGGLGNQLFQYACGRALSLRNGEPLAFDITGYARAGGPDTPRQYLLSRFNIAGGRIASDREIAALKYPFGIASKGMRFIRTKVLRRFNTGFDPKILALKGPAYLDGFWQTEKYFLDCEETIRRELTLKEPMGPAARAVADAIAGSAPSGAQIPPAVSLHVRRGDVAQARTANPYYGIATPEYYARALAHMAGRIGDMRIFVFSDDIGWVKDNISLPPSAVYVSDPAIPDYQELILMSLCDHHIIANSSYSWWGAWLNRDPRKIVVAPREWITRNPRMHKDVVPVSWTRI